MSFYNKQKLTKLNLNKGTINNKSGGNIVGSYYKEISDLVLFSITMESFTLTCTQQNNEVITLVGKFNSGFSEENLKLVLVLDSIEHEIIDFNAGIFRIAIPTIDLVLNESNSLKLYIYKNNTFQFSSVTTYTVEPCDNCANATYNVAYTSDISSSFTLIIGNNTYSFENMFDFISRKDEIESVENINIQFYTSPDEIAKPEFTLYSSKPYPLLFEDKLSTIFSPTDVYREWLITQPEIIEEIVSQFNVLDSSFRVVGETINLDIFQENLESKFNVLETVKGKDLLHLDQSSDNILPTELLKATFNIQDALFRNHLLTAYNLNTDKLTTVLNVLDANITELLEYNTQEKLNVSFSIPEDPVIEGRDIIISCEEALNETEEITVNGTFDIYINNSQIKLNETPLTILEIKELLVDYDIEIEIINE